MMRAKWLGIALLLLAPFAESQPDSGKAGTAEALYLRLRSVGLDSTRSYRIRDASLDRGSAHVSLDDGTITFTEEADGHITGAFFQGDGEVLVIPPNTVERGSLALFTKAAILEEGFSLAYFRFNDDVYTELKSKLRPAEEAPVLTDDIKNLATTLAQADSLRLLISFKGVAAPPEPGDHFLHAYIQGRRLGSFELRYDSALPEPISLTQHKSVNGVDFYDVWASFALKKVQQAEADPDAGLLSAHDFEIQQFKIQCQVKPPTEITSSAILKIVPKRTGNRLLLLELSRLLQVQSVEQDGKPVEFIHNQALEGSRLAKRGNDWLVVFLPEPMKSGNVIELKINYSGSVLSEAANGLLYVGEHGTWYPNIGFSMSSFDLEFQYPLGWTLVAVGKQLELRQQRDQQISRWVTERTVPVAGFNLGKYLRTDAQAAGVRVETFATPNVEKTMITAEADPPLPPAVFPRQQPGPVPVPLPPRAARPSPAHNLEMVNGQAAQAIEFYSQHFGQYPYSGLAISQFPGTTSQGWPGLIFLSSYAFLTPNELEQIVPDPVERLMVEILVSHETAHQWWGDLVTFNGYRDQWLMEALANYSALMVLESKNPSSFRRILQKYRDDLLKKGPDDSQLMDAGPVTLGLRLSSSRFPNAYDAISYGRGTWLFHMLRTMMRDAEKTSSQQSGNGSDEAFLNALRELRHRYEGKSVTTAQLLAVFEEQLPKSLWFEQRKSLDWFFESWLNGTAVPSFEVHDVKILTSEKGTVANGTIIQDRAPETLVTAVPLYAVVGTKQVFLRRVFADGRESAFRVTVPAGTRKILIDPEQTLLSRAK